MWYGSFHKSYIILSPIALQQYHKKLKCAYCAQRKASIDTMPLCSQVLLDDLQYRSSSTTIHWHFSWRLIILVPQQYTFMGG